MRSSATSRGFSPPPPRLRFAQAVLPQEEVGTGFERLWGSPSSPSLRSGGPPPGGHRVLLPWGEGGAGGAGDGRGEQFPPTIPTVLRRLCSVLAPLPRSETEWGRLGGGGFQQRHPEQSVCETRGLNHEPVGHAPNSTVNCWAPPCARLPGSNKASRSQASGIPAVGGHHPPLTPPTALRRLRCEDSASQEGMAHSSGSTLPGLRMLLGSSVFLMARITATASAPCSATR